MININFTLSYIELYLIVVNIFSFLLYGFDKLQAVRNSKNIKRVSENKLFFSSFIGGSLGSIIAMFLFRHKIKKLSFILKFIFIVVLQVAVIYYFKFFT